MSTVHNPTNFEPADYVVEGYLDNQRPSYYGQPIPEFEREVKMWEAEMQAVLGANWRAKCHHCIHCGNGSVRWITAVRHLPTNEVVVFGAVCTDRLGFANKHAFQLAQLQARAEARKVRFTIWNTRQAFIAANPSVAEALEAIGKPEHAKNFFVADVLRKLDQYGSLSERQVAAITQSLARDRAAAERKAAEATEVKGDAPSGRQTVTGEVLSIKVKESEFGPVRKMLVKLANNAKVWTSVPNNGDDVNRGDVITFTATFTVSNDDKGFAFGSRPRFVSKQVAA